MEYQSHNSGLNLNSILPTVAHVAVKAGDFVKKELLSFHHDQVKIKDFNSLVSYVDIEAEKIIVSGLRNIIPNADFLTEENTIALSGESTYTWVIDPLDGTTNFIHSLPFFGVSIALKEKEDFVLGVVYDVMHDVLFKAARSYGATANGKEIFVSETDNLENSVLATGFPYNAFDHMEKYLNLFRALFQNTRGIRRFGSAALDLCYVANGSFGGFFEYGLNPWDVGAGIVIVREAGGQVTDFSGSNNMISDKTILATNGKIHNVLLASIRRHFELNM